MSLFGSGPRSNILQTVAPMYQGIVNAEKQKGASMREAMGAFGQAIDPKTIAMKKFKQEFTGADMSNPDTLFKMSQRLGELGQFEAALGMQQKGMELKKFMAPAPQTRVMTGAQINAQLGTTFPDASQYNVKPDGSISEIGKAQTTVYAGGESAASKKLGAENAKELTDLGKAAEARRGALEQAKIFIKGFAAAAEGKTGAEGAIFSGAGRSALSFLPTTFTTQGELDEQLDSMAEHAARAKLKALGEIRPTDADVKGMKQSLFGIGRSEETNVKLLEQYVRELELQEAKYQGLQDAKEKGTLGSYVLENIDSAKIRPTEIDPNKIANMFVGVSPDSELFAELFEEMTDQQKRIYRDYLKGAL